MLATQINMESHLTDHLVNLLDHDVRAPMKNFVYFLSLSESDALDYGKFSMKPFLEPFFASSSFFVENFIIWNKIIKEGACLAKPYYVSEIIKEIKESFSYQLAAKNIHIIFDGEQTQFLAIDRLTFSFVLKNIFFTTINYSNKGNVICVKLSGDHRVLEISSIDMFMPSNKIERIFNMEEYKNVSGRDIGVLLSQYVLRSFDSSFSYVQNDSGEGVFKWYLS